MEIILIRHGDTDYTIHNKYCGHIDVPLNKKGKEEIERFKKRFERIRVKVDVVYSSDLRRALESAKIIFTKKKILKRKGLREIDFGMFCGLTFKEASGRYPTTYKKWLKDPLCVKIPGGESMTDFSKRVVKSFTDIITRTTGDSIAIVSHGGPIRIILLYLLRLGFDKFWDIDIDVASGYYLECHSAGARILKVI